MTVGSTGQAWLSRTIIQMMCESSVMISPKQAVKCFVILLLQCQFHGHHLDCNMHVTLRAHKGIQSE